MTTKAKLDAIAENFNIRDFNPNPLQRKDIEFRKKSLRHHEVLATYVRFFNRQVENLRRAIVEAKPSSRSREWKVFNRALRIYLDSHEKTYIYELDEKHRARVEELMVELEERVDRGLALIYFCIRNEILNDKTVGADEIEPVIHCRICDLMLRAFGDCARYMGGAGINREHADLRRCMQIFCHQSSEDKGGHQRLWLKVFTNTIIGMMKEDER